MKTSIAELDLLNDREKRYRIWERLHDFHSSGKRLDGVLIGEIDFKQVLSDKWGMLVYADSNPFLEGTH